MSAKNSNMLSGPLNIYLSIQHIVAGSEKGRTTKENEFVACCATGRTFKKARWRRAASESGDRDGGGGGGCT